MATLAVDPQTQARKPAHWFAVPVMPASRMLPFLGAVCRDLRIAADTKAVRVAARLNKSEATVTRFEKGQVQPDDLDGMITAFSDELEVEPTAIWRMALDAWLAAPDELEVPAPIEIEAAAETSQRQRKGAPSSAQKRPPQPKSRASRQQ